MPLIELLTLDVEDLQLPMNFHVFQHLAVVLSSISIAFLGGSRAIDKGREREGKIGKRVKLQTNPNQAIQFGGKKFVHPLAQPRRVDFPASSRSNLAPPLILILHTRGSH
ncbi:unnamed protein product [Lactuca saligna]|uniref:Uncharacterized protein n=1 Tax=Lactuca saligna TaxID=75948 RepID=A0AA36EKB6_LACSI|nr:unnamed protein product [Lactuca saligna]